jgi:hypothetical protein
LKPKLRDMEDSRADGMRIGEFVRDMTFPEGHVLSVVHAREDGCDTPISLL